TVDKSVTILGPGPANLTVDANHLSRVFDITPGHTVTIDGLAIVNGDASFQFPGNSGGGIFNDHSTLTVSNCTFSGNSSISRGASTGTTTRTGADSTAGGNAADRASGNGGGSYTVGRSGSATLTVTASTISGNSAGGGGGIYNNGGSSISNCIVSGNSAGGGG